MQFQMHLNWIARINLFAACCLAFHILGGDALAQDADQIWSPRHEGDRIPISECFFRKKFTLINPEKGEVRINADDSFELYVNGDLVDRGSDNTKIYEINVSNFLKPGVNLIAFKVDNFHGNQAGLSAKFRVKETGETRWRSLITDDTWKTRTSEVPSWPSSGYNDIGWLNARVITRGFLKNDMKSVETRAATGQPSIADYNRDFERRVPIVQGSDMKNRMAQTTDSRRQLTETPATDEATAATTIQDQVASNASTAIENKDSAPAQTAADPTIKKDELPAISQQDVAEEVIESKVAAKQVSTVISKPNDSANLTTNPTTTTNPTVSRNPAGPVAATSTDPESQFDLDPEFKVEKLLANDQSGSVIAIAFNEFGKLIFSQEGGPLMIADLGLALEDPNRVKTLCDEVTSCQGILPLNGDIFVTGDGPEGLGLYRLSGTPGELLTVKSVLIKFSGEMGEHGPHGLRLGNDGMIYCVCGNWSQVTNEVAVTSPYQNPYEGDLVKRYEDPGGHSAGVKAPGGTVLRLSLDGKKIETVAGGLRNVYDFAFDQWGELFVHDSDMESDMGMTWYRPTLISHVVAGAELGWRSGWAKFPGYYPDVTPPAAETGRGSPTGAVCYQHIQYPARFHNAFFFADWSEGRILVATSNEKNDRIEMETEVFLAGKPLNVTDLEVGQDGSLYYSTGGRGTEGGIYRVVWKGKVPDSVLNFDNDLVKVIRQPQPNSPWARQNIALLQKELRKTWSDDISGIAKEERNKSSFRTRALDIMVIYGPFPSTELLQQLATDDNVRVRAKVAAICGLRTGNEDVLKSLINDDEPLVRRHACESYLRLDRTPDIDALFKIFAEGNQFECVAARRLLERTNQVEWFPTALEQDNIRVYIQSAIAAMTSNPDLDNAYAILARASEFMNEYVSDRDFVDLLRVVQLTLVQGKVPADKVPAFVERMKNEFPSGSGVINRELSRILAYLKTGDLDGRIAEYFKETADSDTDKTHVAMYLQTIGDDLSGSGRIAIVDQLEHAKTLNEGGSYKLYLTKAIESVSSTMTDEQVVELLENGHRWPTAVITAFYRLPQKLSQDQVKLVVELDQRLKRNEDAKSKQARLGVIAVLAQSADDISMEYLRKLWQIETSRRGDIAIGLAQKPDAKNWPYLVSSLPALDDVSGQEVLSKLTQVDLRPKKAEFYRYVLEMGFRMENKGAKKASALIKHWSGEKTAKHPNDWRGELDYWREWYKVKFPEGPAVQFDVKADESNSSYSVSQIMDYLKSTDLPGDAERGHQLFADIQCSKCHRFGSFGDSTGPDLTSVAKRFSDREIIEAIVNPSKVISDQYKTKKVLTQSGLQFTGVLLRNSDGYTVLDAHGKKYQVPLSDVEAINDSPESAMPAGLLNALSLQDINDLMAYMQSSSRSSVAESNDEPKVSR